MHAEPIFVKEAFQIGSMAISYNKSAAAELLDAVRLVLRNHRHISSHLPGDVREIAEMVAVGMPILEYSGRPLLIASKKYLACWPEVIPVGKLASLQEFP